MEQGGDNMFSRDNAVLLKSEPAPLPNGHGTYKNIVVLTWLNDDMTTTTMFGCIQCGYQDIHKPKLAVHVGVAHNGKLGQMGRRGKPNKNSNSTQNSMAKIEAIIANLEAERDLWKGKARKYERQLKALQNALIIE